MPGLLFISRVVNDPKLQINDFKLIMPPAMQQPEKQKGDGKRETGDGRTSFNT